MYGSRLQLLVPPHVISLQLNRKLNLIRMDDLFINEMLTSWKRRYMYLRMYICVCVRIYIPPNPQRRWGKWERSEKARGWFEKRQYLPGEDHHCPLHPFYHSFKANTLTSLSWELNLELNVCLHLSVFLTHLLYIHLVRFLPVWFYLFWGRDILCILKYFLNVHTVGMMLNLLHTTWFSLNDILKNNKLQGWLPGVRGRGSVWLQRVGTREFFGKLELYWFLKTQTWSSWYKYHFLPSHPHPKPIPQGTINMDQLHSPRPFSRNFHSIYSRRQSAPLSKFNDLFSLGGWGRGVFLCLNLTFPYLLI